MDQQATATDNYAELYRQAFAQYAAQALWYMRRIDNPTPEDALAVARSLRIEGDLRARFLAEKIEQSCRAAH